MLPYSIINSLIISITYSIIVTVNYQITIHTLNVVAELASRHDNYISKISLHFDMASEKAIDTPLL